MNPLVAGVAKRLLGDYELFQIYTLPLPAAESAPGAAFGIRPLEGATELSQSPAPEMRRLSVYAGSEALGYGAFVGDELAAACWIWYGDRYRGRNFWPLKEQEAKLIQVTTADRHRGKGLGLRLLHNAAWDLERRGFKRLYARIWHSNLTSIRLFEKAGWRRIAFVAEIYPLGLAWRVRLRWGRIGRA